MNEYFLKNTITFDIFRALLSQVMENYCESLYFEE